MIDFFLFLMGFLASVAIIVSAPDQLLREYLLTYSFSSAIFGFLTFMVYSKVSDARYIKAFPIAILFAALVSLSAFDFSTIVMITYPALLIFSDYLATQSFSRRFVTFYRVVLLLTSLPFFIWQDEFFRNLILRTGLLAVMVLALLWIVREHHRISVHAPIKYLLSNYIFYNGFLIVLALLIIDTAELKVWYIAMQGGFALALKYLDFTLRRSYKSTESIVRFVYCGSSLVLIGAVSIYPNILACALYFLGFLGLMNARKYITVNADIKLD